ncbi:MAG: hypothetical protein CM15mP18_4770 [Methanobacteriota archaeon]|nr:MAG: hypothetical protein CM15mP18_4770 [Euryarchaeota archaeon]
MADLRPPSPESDADEMMTLWMADTGLLGERPGARFPADLPSHRLFLMLLERDAPLSTDEAAEAVGCPQHERDSASSNASGPPAWVRTASREQTAWPPPLVGHDKLT